MAEVPDRMELRASDADRERVAEILRSAAGEGRLDLNEVDERLSAVYAARTYGELVPLTRDLPSAAGTVAVPAVGSVGRAGAAPTSHLGIAVLGGFQRRGSWLVPRKFTTLAFWGGGEIDLREAHLTAGEVTIRAFALMGGISILVPTDAEVHVTGIGIMGGFDDRASGPGVAGAVRIVVTGLAFWGGVEVRRRPSDAELQRRKREKQDRRQLPPS